MANKKQNDTTNNDAGFANETMQKQTVEQNQRPSWDISSVKDKDLREFAQSVISALKEENEQLLAEQEEFKKQIKKGEEYLNQLVILKSDFENYRRRTTSSVETAKADGRMEVVEKIFPILDTFDKARQMLKKEEMATFNLVLKQFESILNQVGVKKMEVLGKEFDPNVCSAVYKQPVLDKQQDNLVLEEYASGYIYGEKVLRYATVCVGVFEETAS